MKFIFIITLMFSIYSQAAESLFEVTVQEGGIQINMSADQLQVPEEYVVFLKEYLQKKVEQSSFHKSGQMNLLLQGEKAEKLMGEILKLDLSKTDEAKTQLDSLWEQFEIQKQFLTEEAEDYEVIVGRSFQVQSNQSYKNLVIIGARGEILGQLQSVVLIGSQVVFGPGSRVSESLVSVGSHYEVDAQAQISANKFTMSLPFAGTLWDSFVQDQSFKKLYYWSERFDIWWTLAVFSVLFIIGLLYLYIAGYFNQVAIGFLKENRMFSFGLGIISWILLFPLTLVLILTVVGIFFIPFYYVLFGLFVGLGYLIGVFYLGTFFGKMRPSVLTLVIGLLAFQALRLLPYLGLSIICVFSLMGLGAAIVALIKVLKGQLYITVR